MHYGIRRHSVPLLALIAFPCQQAIADGVYSANGLKQWFDQPPVLPPLDTSLLFARKTTTELCRDCTGEILSLIYEQSPTDQSVHLWPLFVQLDAANANGSATGTNARVYSRSSGWAAAHHGEAIAYSAGSTNIGFNAEMSPMVAGNRMIGLNLQAKNGYFNQPAGEWSTEAVNIQSDPGVGWKTGIQFDTVRTETGIDFGPRSSGTRAIRIRGDYAVGLDVGGNSIRMNAGSRVCFDQNERICLRYNPQRNRLEFLNGSGLVAFLNMGRNGKRCLNC